MAKTRLWSWPLTPAVAIAWHETSCTASNRKTENNCWCQQGHEEKPSWAAIPSEFAYSKTRWSANQTWELSVAVCTRTEGFAPHKVGKKSVGGRGYFTAWCSGTATNTSIRNSCSVVIGNNGLIIFFHENWRWNHSLVTFPLDYNALSSLFSMVYVSTELQNLDCLTLFSGFLWQSQYEFSVLHVWVKPIFLIPPRPPKHCISIILTVLHHMYYYWLF